MAFEVSEHVNQRYDRAAASIWMKAVEGLPRDGLDKDEVYRRIKDISRILVEFYESEESQRFVVEVTIRPK